MNSWDLNFEEIERGVVKVVPRKPTPLFSPAVEKEKNTDSEKNDKEICIGFLSKTF